MGNVATEINGVGIIQPIGNYVDRVNTDGGTVENVRELLNAKGSICIIPSGKKIGKIYAVNPTNGTGDVTITRPTTPAYTDRNGNIVNALVDEAVFDYVNGEAEWVKSPDDVVTPFGTVNLFDKNEGYLFFESSIVQDANVKLFNLREGGTNNSNLQIVFDGTVNRVKLSIYNGGLWKTDLFYTLTDVQIQNKYCLVWKDTYIKFFVNGALRVSYTLAQNFTHDFDNISINNNFDGRFKQIKTDKYALTDAEANELTKK